MLRIKMVGRTTWRWGVLIVAGLIIPVIPPSFAESDQGRPVPLVRRLKLQVDLAGPRLMITNSIVGAARRLESPECLEILSDFTDAEGITLATRLRAKQVTVPDYVASLRYVDGDDDRLCRRDDITAGFTRPGSLVISLCASRFARGSSLDGTGGEIVIIHEMLHTLGLGENPPSTSEISDRIRRRCGS